MSFLHRDEAIVVMDVCPEGGMTTRAHIGEEDLRRLRDCGVQTVLEYVAWGAIEKEKGVRDWGHLDEYIERARRAGMKVILSTPHFVPGCFPDEWYPWGRDGKPMVGNVTIQSQAVLSIFNDEALDYEVGFIREIRARYEAEDVLLFCAQQVEGETVYNNNWAYGDPSAQASWKRERVQVCDFPLIDEWLARRYEEVLVRLQGAFLAGSRHGEIWTALHPLLSEMILPECRGNGCRWIERFFGAYRREWPNVEMTWLQYTFWPHEEGYRKKVGEVRRRFGMDLVTGAEWIEGLRANTGRAIEEGLSALLVGLLHPFTRHEKVEEWMLEIVREAQKQWKNPHPTLSLKGRGDLEEIW